MEIKMNIKKTTHYTLAFCLLFSFNDATTAQHKPRLTIIFIVDQFSYNALQKYRHYFKHGLQTLISKGVEYTNAYHPHAMPATATGHAALSTGTYAKNHGIISNTWLDENNTLTTACSDTYERAAVFSPTGTYDYGVSSRLLMVDTLSDQFTLQSTHNKNYHSYALSMKDYAAVQIAGKLGKAIWFDGQTGHFTSSKAYFESLPLWIKNFNNKHCMDKLQQVTWSLAKPCISNAYIWAHEQSFEHADHKEGLVGTQVPIEWDTNPKNPFSLFMQTPHANKLLLDCAQTCINTHITKKNDDQLLLWISLSSLDKAGHAFGPDSKETIDIIYHLDKQLERFMRCARRIAGKKETLFVLTSDHGISPIIENLEKKGIPCQRYASKDMIKNLNKHIHTKHAESSLISGYSNPQFYLNHSPFNRLDPKKQEIIIKDAKQFLTEQKGVKQIWTYNELQSSIFEPNTLESYYKNQLYPGRSGQLIVQMLPYYDISDYRLGADHTSPYDYNTHVPLILFQHGSIELKTIGQRVSTLQLANTLADILQIPKPSASTSERLPGIDAEINDLLF